MSLKCPKGDTSHVGRELFSGNNSTEKNKRVKREKVLGVAWQYPLGRSWHGIGAVATRGSHVNTCRTRVWREDRSFRGCLGIGDNVKEVRGGGEERVGRA